MSRLISWLGEVRHHSIGQDRGGYDFAPVIIRVAQLDKGSFGFAVIARMYQSECHFASPPTREKSPGGLDTGAGKSSGNAGEASGCLLQECHNEEARREGAPGFRIGY